MEKLPQSVLKRLQETAPAAESHPDPDLLTAFTEHSLPERERNLVVDHLAYCGDCRDILAIAAAAVESPQSEIAPWASRTPRPWFAWPVLRWTALAAGVLIVASVGILQYSHHRQNTLVASNSVPNETSISAQSRASAPDNAETKAPHDEPSDEQNILTATKKSGPHTPQSESRVGVQRESDPASLPRSGAAAEKQPSTTARPGEIRSRERKILPGYAAGAETQLAQNQAVPPLSGQATNVDVVKAKNPVPTQASPSPTAAAAMPQQSQSSASPGNFRWAINAGALQRSDDGGRTWQDLNPSPDSAAEFFSIAVNGSEVWVGGSASLYYSTDAGTHWTPITLSAKGATLTGNVIGIQFSDPVHGKITTSTSEIWITSDAGQSWQRGQ